MPNLSDPLASSLHNFSLLFHERVLFNRTSPNLSRVLLINEAGLFAPILVLFGILFIIFCIYHVHSNVKRREMRLLRSPFRRATKIRASDASNATLRPADPPLSVIYDPKEVGWLEDTAGSSEVPRTSSVRAELHYNTPVCTSETSKEACLINYHLVDWKAYLNSTNSTTTEAHSASLSVFSSVGEWQSNRVYERPAARREYKF